MTTHQAEIVPEIVDTGARGHPHTGLRAADIQWSASSNEGINGGPSRLEMSVMVEEAWSELSLPVSAELGFPAAAAGCRS
jgi:hypothetical protein